MRIAVIAHVRHPIAPPFMGGMEAHADLLVRALQAEGHEVVLLASGDSAPDLPLVPICARAYEADLPFADWRGTERLKDWLEQTYRAAWDWIAANDVDVVHNNSLFPGIHHWARRDGRAMVTSLHIPPYPALADAVAREAAPSHRLTVTSASQLPMWEEYAPGRIDVAHNGIDLDRWRFVSAGNGRAIWAGRITPNKGTVEAIRGAKAAGIGLDIVGPIDRPSYFAAVEPLLDAERRYLGHLAGDDLVARIGAASVMLCTPLWDEPFGLVGAEALACGVPVAALDRGALAEVIGHCGALAATPDQLPDAIRRAAAVSRHSCRERAATMFGASAMVARYERSYAAALAGADSSKARTLALLA